MAQSIRLPSDCGENIDNYVNAVAPGNGMTTFTGGNKHDTTLREVNVTTVPYGICEKLADHMIGIKTIICGSSQSNQSTFHGDSGKCDAILLIAMVSTTSNVMLLSSNQTSSCRRALYLL